MNNPWDVRYSVEEYIYGTAPNNYLRNFLDRQKPGKILFPAEGEGRNAVYAASQGWETDAFDTSREGMKKALRLAETNRVKINYFIHDITNLVKINSRYDVIALIFAHLHKSVRKKVHREMINLLTDGGYIILNAFAKEQLSLTTGGPKDINMLYSIDELKDDFKDLKIIELKQERIWLNEGKLHQGWSENIFLTAQK